MRILGLDPGALRLGWAVVEAGIGGFTLLSSGIGGLERQDEEKFSDYRIRLIHHWVKEFGMFEAMGCDMWYAERLPAVGGGNFIAATQAELAKTALTTLQAMAYLNSIPVHELDASHVKSRLTGKGTATKVGVRNAVIQVFPELWARKKEILADESDAIGIALIGAGYKHVKSK